MSVAVGSGRYERVYRASWIDIVTTVSESARNQGETIPNVKQTSKDKSIKNLAVTPKRKFGGRQKGAGRPKGALGPKARTALEIKNRIAQAADNLLNAEMVEALGSLVVMRTNPDDPLSGFTRVTDEDEIIKFIQEHKGANGRMGEHVYVLTAKDGNYKSRQYLFDRAFGRPSQAVEVKTDDTQIAELAKRVVQELLAQGKNKDEAVKFAVERYGILEDQLVGV